MKSRPSTRTIFLLALILPMIALLAWWLFFHREPVYRGVPVRAWVQQLKNTQNTEKNETFHLLIDIGPACLPALAAELRPMDNFFTRTYARLWPKLPQVLARLLPRPTISRAERRATAAWALGQIGPAARPMAPALVKALDDPDDNVRMEAAQALRWVNAKDPAAIDALARRLSDAVPIVRSRATESLWQMAPESAAALGPLTQLLSDPNHAYHGALCLEQLGPLASNSIPPLIEVMKRGVAGQSQPKFKPPLGGRSDPSAHNRAMAAKALGAIGVSSEEVLTALRDALDYPAPWVRQNAAMALGRFGTNSIFAMEALAFTLGDTNPPVIQEAALSLGAMGTNARPILPELTNLLSRLPEPLTTQLGLGESAKWQMFWLKCAVARAILQVDPDNTIAPGVLLEEIDKDAYARRLIAARGARFRDLVPRLEKSLSTASGQPAVAHAELLWHIDPKHPGIVPALQRAMEHTNSSVRGFAAFWYWKVTGDADTSLRVLAAALEEPASPVSQSFPQWLADMGPAARPAIPALKRALWHHDIFARRNAAKALEKIDPANSLKAK